MNANIYRKIGTPGVPTPDAILARVPCLRIVDGKADIITTDSLRWPDVMTAEGTPLESWHIGVHWVPMWTDGFADRFTYGVLDDCGVWDGDPNLAAKRTYGRSAQ